MPNIANLEANSYGFVIGFDWGSEIRWYYVAVRFLTPYRLLGFRLDVRSTQSADHEYLICALIEIGNAHKLGVRAMFQIVG